MQKKNTAQRNKRNKIDHAPIKIKQENHNSNLNKRGNLLHNKKCN